MAHGRARQIIFRIFYSTSFTVVFLLTIGFCCAGPIDALYQSYSRGRIIDMFLITGVYLLTGLLACFLYASRLYTNRSILKDIPKTYMPVDKYELPGKRIWRLIEDCKSRSAVIAHQARPRARRIENELPHARERINTLLRSGHGKEDRVFDPQWGKISHPGWSSPAATETPNLPYATVVAELTNLIEARAVSLAPTHPASPTGTDSGAETELLADPYVIEVLRRPEEIGMRQYVSQLISLGVLDDSPLSVAFLTLYERARFCPDPLSEDEFKTLMRMFAEILRSMRTLDISILDVPDEYDGPREENRESDLIRRGAAEKFFAVRNANASVTFSVAETASSSGSVRHHYTPSKGNKKTAPPRVSEDYPRSLSLNMDVSDGDNTYAEANENWAAVTPRPPFFRSPTSDSRSTSYSIPNNSGHRTRTREFTSRLTSRSSRLSLARLRRRRSVESKGTTASMRSARSHGSVIRLVSNPEAQNEGRMFEFIPPGDGQSDEPHAPGPPPANVNATVSH